MPRLFRPTQPPPHRGAPSLWPPVASPQAPCGPSGAPRSPARVPRLSPRFLTTMEALTSRCASTQPFGLCLIARSTPPALRPRPGGMNTLCEDATRSPQVRRSSVPPCRPHTPCLGARSAGISFAVRLPARISALMADRFAMALPPRLRPGGSTQALRIPSRDGHPALLAARAARPPGPARPLVYASPLRGCGGTFTRKRNALLCAQPQSVNRSRGQTVTSCALGRPSGSNTKPIVTCEPRDGAPITRQPQGAYSQVRHGEVVPRIAPPNATPEARQP